jgi:HSP20 family protein
VTLIRRPTPLGELISLRATMDRLFDDTFGRPRNGWLTASPAVAVDVHSTGDAVVVQAALPGVKPEDVDISVLGETLTITASSASDAEQNEDGYTYREIRRGSFTRTVTLPKNLKTDEATATFENGLLRLSIPMAEAAKPRQIKISAVTESQPTVEPTAEPAAEPAAEQSS